MVFNNMLMWLHVPMQFKSDRMPLIDIYIERLPDKISSGRPVWNLIEDYISIFKSGPSLVKQLPQHKENLQDFSNVRALCWWVWAVGDRGDWLFHVKSLNFKEVNQWWKAWLYDRWSVGNSIQSSCCGVLDDQFLLILFCWVNQPQPTITTKVKL